MKHHIKIVVSVPVCRMGVQGIVKDEFLPGCCGDYDCEPCEAYNPMHKDGVTLIGGRCVYLDFIEKHIAFDCTSYEYDEINGFKSRGRFYEPDEILSLKIDGETMKSKFTELQE